MEFEQKEYIESRNNPDDYFYCDHCEEITMVDDIDLDDIRCGTCNANGDWLQFFEG